VEKKQFFSPFIWKNKKQSIHLKKKMYKFTNYNFPFTIMSKNAQIIQIK